MLMDESTVLNKVRPANKVAQIYRGEQQLSMQISVTRRTVDIDEVSEQDSKRYKCVIAKIGGKTRYLNCTSEEKDVKITVKGEWNPLTGDVEVYHYEEGPLGGSHQMVDKYLEWVYDPSSKTYIRPTAKK
jgi:hypothetical protein